MGGGPSRETLAAEAIRRGLMRPEELRGLGIDPNRVPDPAAGPIDLQPPVQVQRDNENKFLLPIRGEATTSRNVRDLGQRFQGYNRDQATGGLTSYLPPVGNGRMQAMEGLTSDMMRATMVPGTSGTMNSNVEQQFAQARLPNRRTVGPVNDDRVRALEREAWLKAARLDAAEKWLSARNTPDGFEAAWQRNLPIWEREYEARRAPRGGAALAAAARPDQSRRDIANQQLRAKSASAPYKASNGAIVRPAGG